jgi:hypothetical protein
MAKSKVGERYSISFAIPKVVKEGETPETVVFNDASVHSFLFNEPLNHLPYGSATIVGPTDSTCNPGSGTYGSMIVDGLRPGDPLSLPIYILAATRSEIGQDLASIDLTFIIGTEETQKHLESLAIDGTSVEAMNQVFKVAGIEPVDYASAGKSPGSISDNMTWRLVEGSLDEYLQDIVEHASIPGDVLYWAYDDAALGFRIGTFNVSKAAKAKHFFMYTSDAVTPTASATAKVKGTDTSIWYYSGYTPSDLAGATREARSPNLIIDSTATGSAKETGDCTGECWRSILGAMGGDASYMEKSDFGKQHVVKPFPANTHKTYAIAPFVRSYLLAQYSKMVKVQIFNHPGPALGECVHFYAASAKLRSGDFLPDENYTARYIVVGKRIAKSAEVATGMLGKARSENTTNLVTEITMVSNNGYAGMLSPDYKSVLSLAQSIPEKLKKGGTT